MEPLVRHLVFRTKSNDDRMDPTVIEIVLEPWHGFDLSTVIWNHEERKPRYVRTLDDGRIAVGLPSDSL